MLSNIQDMNLDQHIMNLDQPNQNRGQHFMSGEMTVCIELFGYVLVGSTHYDNDKIYSKPYARNWYENILNN